MTKLNGWKMGCALLAFCAATAMLSLAQDTLTTLVSFGGLNGSDPYMVLTQGADGNFYGTTQDGGANCLFDCGTVFKMTPSGTLTTLYSFCSQTNCADGDVPIGALVQAANGDFFGTTSGGGTHGWGTVFKITPTGTLTTIYNFCTRQNCTDGKVPDSGLVQGRNGNFYGTTDEGGFGGGTVFEISPAGKLTTLHSFDGTDGYEPFGALVLATNGNFYGETSIGGTTGDGTIFEITPGGYLTTLFSFDGANGSAPLGGLIQAANGAFYGVTTNFPGTVFTITSGGKLTTLYNFCSLPGCTDGSQPYGPLAQGTDGNFYGTTSDFETGNGTIFEITPGGSLTTLYTFCSLPGCTDGAAPTVGMLQATNGMFYGTTSTGGSFLDGTIFSLSTGLGQFVKTQPLSADEGATIGIFGQGFTRSSVVQFDGVQATSVKLYGADLLEAKVPPGALTGSVTVTTNGTTLTSNEMFRVSPQVLSFSPPSGPVGTQVTINGTGFTQASGVGFGDNVPAQFTVNSDTEITATVPSGAKTGPIGVVTKGGTAISSGTFTVN